MASGWPQGSRSHRGQRRCRLRGLELGGCLWFRFAIGTLSHYGGVQVRPQILCYYSTGEGAAPSPLSLAKYLIMEVTPTDF